MNYHFPNTLLAYRHDLIKRYRVLFDLRIVCENDMIKDTPSEAEGSTPVNVVTHSDIDSNQSLSRKENTVTEDQDHG